MGKSTKDFAKVAKRANKSARKTAKRYNKKIRRELASTRKSAEKTYGKLSFGQKLAFYGGFVVFVAALSALFSRGSK